MTGSMTGRGDRFPDVGITDLERENRGAIARGKGADKRQDAIGDSLDNGGEIVGCVGVGGG